MRRGQGRRGFVRRAPYYGWYVVGALFFSMFLGVGLRQGFGIFVETWEREFGATVAAVSVAASIGWFMNGASQVLMGWLIDRVGGRVVVTVATAAMGIGCALMALVNNVFLLVVVYGALMSLASGGLSGGPPTAIAARWFRRRRGTAISVLVSGGSVGGLVLVPFLTYLFVWTNWRAAWLVASAIALVLGVPLLWTAVRNDPRDLGLLPDGDAPADRGQLPVESQRPAVAEAWEGPLAVSRWQSAYRSAPIWQLSVAYWVCGVTTASITVHYVRWALSEGIAPTTAALAFGLLSAINAAGVLAIGILSDRLPRRVLLGVVYLIRALAFVLLVVLPGPSALWAFAVVGGASWLATVPLTSSLTADVYGLRRLGTLVGMANFFHQVGGALAVYLFGLAFDLWDSYDLAFLVGAGLLVAAGLLSLSIRERRWSVRYAGSPPSQ